jgi:hypothetical protein
MLSRYRPAMPRGPRGEKRPADVVGAAIMVAKIATGEITDSVRSVAKRAKGGKKLAEKLSPDRHSQIAKKPPEARWGISRLPLNKRVQILSILVEGSPMHKVSQVCEVSIRTVSKLLVDAGNVCANFHHKRAEAVRSKRIQCSEIWSFRRSEAKNGATKSTRDGAGDMWTWTALDADSKLIVSWIVGGRDIDTAYQFIDDLLSRLANGVQLTRDGYVGGRQQSVTGNPDPTHISGSSVKPHNLTMRTRGRRFPTNGLTRKLDNHCHGLALYFFWHNWCRTNKAGRVSPAMAAGLTDKLMDMADIANMVEAAAPKRGPRRRYATDTEHAERDRLDALARFEAEINPIKLIIREEWTLPADFLPEKLTGFANELWTRIKAGQAHERLYGRAAFVQVHDMKIPLSPAHRTLVDRVYTLLRRKNSN